MTQWLFVQVRRTRTVTIQPDEEVDGLQHLLALPGSRAFSNVTKLSAWTSTRSQTFSVAEWACFSDALAAAAATWPMLEEVALSAQPLQEDDDQPDDHW
jgi:hypothetical protein